MAVTSDQPPERPAARLLEALRDASDRTLICNALRHYADAMTHTADHVGIGASNIRNAGRRADAIATIVERSF
jgi:DNA-binding NtrC family response regulator